MIKQMLDGKLQLYVSKQGGPDSLLHFGRKETERLSAELYFGNNGYKFTLEPSQDNRMMFASESLWWIVKTIRLVAPFFWDFVLRPRPDSKDQIELEWTEKGEDVPFKTHLLSVRCFQSRGIGRSDLYSVAGS